MSEKSSPLLHPFLFAVAPILFLFAHNANELPLFDRNSIIRLLLPGAIALCLAWALRLGLQRVVAKDRLLAGMLASLLLFLFFGFGHAQGVYFRTVERLGGDLRYVVRGIPFGHYKFFFALWTAGGIAAIGLFLRWARSHRGSLPGLTAYLNRVAAILLLMAMIQIAWTESGRVLHSKGNKGLQDIQAAPAAGRSVDHPDIYYIILDSYPAAGTLRESYGFDNQDFLDYLIGKGFYLAAKSRSNYTSTLMSLGSSLNFEHFDFLSTTLGRESTNISLPMHMLENSRAMRFLKANGYSFVNFRTPIGPAAKNRHADWDVDCNRGLIGDEFLRLLIETTLLEPFSRTYSSESRRERILCQFATLPRIRDNPALRRPLFVLAHILCPHWPYIFGRDGLAPSGISGQRAQGKQLFVDQLIFVNQLVMRMLDELLVDPGQQPVVILQGDHGPLDHPEKESEQMFRNRTRILNAYLLPPEGAAMLYDSISPVNTFRVILNHFFGTAYPLLEDRTFYSDPNDRFHFKLQDVTDIVKYSE